MSEPQKNDGATNKEKEMSDDNNLASVVYRLYTRCPYTGRTVFQEALPFLHSFGIEPEMVDDGGHNFLQFSLPKHWSLGRRREFNESLAEKTSSAAQPCESCGNVQYSRAHLDTCKGCGKQFVVCEECLLEDVEPGEAPSTQDEADSPL